jgi:hypothetical protein
MIGMDPREQRAALEEDFDVLMHLLLKDEPISVETKQYKLVEARSQYRPSAIRSSTSASQQSLRHQVRG